MTTKTLDERIREKAREELKKEIQSAFEGADHQVRVGTSLWIEGAKGENGASMYAYDLLEMVRQAIYAHKVAEAEEAAVAAFIAKVDGLDSQIDELRSSLGSENY